jgi:hypothetical protein
MSAGLNALAGERDAAPVTPERFEVGEVAHPTSVGDELLVVLDSLPEQLVTVFGWQARTTPVVKGDRCLTVRVGTGDYWFVTWDLPGWSS